MLTVVVIFLKSCFCGEVLAFTHYAFSLRTGRCAGYMIGIYPKASGFRLEVSLSPQGGFL